MSGATVGTKPELNRNSRQGNDVPLPDQEWFAKWRAVAKIGMPTPDEWGDAITSILWLKELEKNGFENAEFPDGMTASCGSLQFLLKLLMPGVQPPSDAQRARLDLMTAGAFAPLLRLHTAITDLADGRKPALFEPKRKSARGGNPGKGNVDDFLQAMAARALEELQKARIKQARAAERVAKAYNEGYKSNLRSSRTVTGDTVINWRENIRRRRASETAIRHFGERLPEYWGEAPKVRGETILRALRARIWIVD